MKQLHYTKEEGFIVLNISTQTDMDDIAQAALDEGREASHIIMIGNTEGGLWHGGRI